MRIAIPEGISRQLFGGRAVSFREQWRQVLRVVLILETVDEILGRKLVGGSGLVAQQIANRVVVLAVRQPASTALGAPDRFGACSMLAIFHALSRVRSPDSVASLWIQALRTASSGLPGLMRNPPVCGTRSVGFFNSSESSGCSRSTSFTSE